MKQKTILLIMVALIVMSVPAMALKVAVKQHEYPCVPVYQAYCGQTGTATCLETGNAVFMGLNPLGADVITAVPGVLAINPGGTQPANGWPNFVSASQVTDGTVLYSGAAIPGSPKVAILATGATYALPWTVTNVTLRKTVPTYLCTVAIGGAPVLQQGSANIRLWWPLMYELPGTKWTLTISYKTTLWEDGYQGNPAATTHVDVWCWTVDATLPSLANLVDLFHELPVGSCQVPLINGKDLYESLQSTLVALKSMDPADPDMSLEFDTFILLLEDSCLTVDCNSACSGDVGIRNTSENPACCKLLADADYIYTTLHVGVAGK